MILLFLYNVSNLGAAMIPPFIHNVPNLWANHGRLWGEIFDVIYLLDKAPCLSIRVFFGSCRLILFVTLTTLTRAASISEQETTKRKATNYVYMQPHSRDDWINFDPSIMTGLLAYRSTKSFHLWGAWKKGRWLSCYFIVSNEGWGLAI